MKLLLDTHIWLWNLLEPERISPKVAKALGSSENDLWLSPISVWETLKLADKGRILPNRDAVLWVRQALERTALRQAPLNHEVVLAIAEVQLPHSDPADCFLAATARVYDLKLVTADKHLIAGHGFSVLSNR